MTGRSSAIPDYVDLPPSKLTNKFGLHNENKEAITLYRFIRDLT